MAEEVRQAMRNLEAHWVPESKTRIRIAQCAMDGEAIRVPVIPLTMSVIFDR